MHNLQSDNTQSFSIGIDIGGTFTDIVVSIKNKGIISKKVNSTPEDYSLAAISGLSLIIKENNLNPKNSINFAHATTVATNTILEGKGASTALITTSGFRDILEFRRVRFPELYNLQYKKPKPLIKRRYRYEISERLNARGKVKIPINENELKNIAKKLKNNNIKSVAICFLHSYLNPSHEVYAKEVLKKFLDDDTFICCSYEILPEIREYERTSTTVVNAYLGPTIKRYLKKFSSRLDNLGINASRFIMQSNGGQMTFEDAIQFPAYLLESGPAAGVVAASELSKQKNIKKAITLDIGGTTAKTAIIENFGPSRTGEYEVGSGINLSSKLTRGAGYAVKLPFIDISEIGAGGGSIVWFDEGGLLKVGPESAGSDPGPIAYDKGGKNITLTDANIVIGILNSNSLLGGSMKIKGDLSKSKLNSLISKKLKMSVYDTANGIIKIAVGNMVRAVKSVTTYQGKDPRNFTLIVYGGNGSLLAPTIADDLNIKKILIPNYSGVLSAKGLLFAATTYEKVKSFQILIKNLNIFILKKTFSSLKNEIFKNFLSANYNIKKHDETFYLDLRYYGQAYELTIKLKNLNNLTLEKISQLFHKEYYKIYGTCSLDEEVELVSIRLSISNKKPKNTSQKFNQNFSNNKNSLEKREVFFPKPIGKKNVIIYTNRNSIISKKLRGPAIIEDYDSTTIVPIGWEANIDLSSNILLNKISEKK